jgi:hypothetical protein
MKVKGPMIRGDSKDYDLLDKWTKDFDCQGYKPVRSEYVKGSVQKLLWITLLITIFMLVSILMETLKYQHYD